MQDTEIFVTKLDDSKREISWVELNQLKKDILWAFDFNGSELHNSFVPEYSFVLPYWEHTNLNGGELFYDEDKFFYREGALIIVLCMVVEYIDIQGGNQLVFGDTKLKDVLVYVQQFEPSNDKQEYLKSTVIQGLSIGSTITKEDMYKNEDFEHVDLSNFYSKLSWISKEFIQAYYKSKLSAFEA